MRRQCIDDGGEIAGRKEPSNPRTLCGEIAIDSFTEFEGQPGLAGPRAPNQGVDGNVRFIIEPNAELREEVFASNIREFSCFRNKQVEFAQALVRGRLATAFRMRKLLALQRQYDPGLTKAQRDTIAVPRDDDALTDLFRVDRLVVH